MITVSTLCRVMVDSPSDALGKILVDHMEVILHLIENIGLAEESTVWLKPDNSIGMNVPRLVQLP